MRNSHSSATKLKTFSMSAFDALVCRRISKTQVAGFRVHFFSGWNRFADGFDADDFAEVAEVANEGERIHAAAQDIGAKAYRNVPAVGVDHAPPLRADLDEVFVDGQAGAASRLVLCMAGFKDFSQACR